MIEGFFPATSMPDDDWWNALWPDPAQVLIRLNVLPDMDAVDLCCGDGLFTAPLARIVRRVIALDLDPHMLDLARARLATTPARNCTFTQCDAYDVDRAVRWPADFVLIANTFHGVPHKQRLTEAVAATLRPGGRFAVVNWHRRPREDTVVLGEPRGPPTAIRMTPEDVAAVVEPADLRLSQVIELPPYHYGAIFSKTTA